MDRGVVCDDSGGVLVDTSLAGIWIVDPASKAKQRVAREGAFPRWSPDGLRIALENRGTISLLEPVSGEQQPIVGGSHATWHPSGDEIAFDVTSHGEGSFIWRISVDGRGLQRMSPFSGVTPSWRPDGEALLYLGISSSQSTAIELLELDLVDSTIHRTSTVEARYPEYSPDGSRVAFGSKGKIWVIDTAGTNTEHIAIGGYPSWSPDGTGIVYTNGDTTLHDTGVLWIVDIKSGSKSPLTDRWPVRCTSAVIPDS